MGNEYRVANFNNFTPPAYSTGFLGAGAIFSQPGMGLFGVPPYSNDAGMMGGMPGVGTMGMSEMPDMGMMGMPGMMGSPMMGGMSGRIPKGLQDIYLNEQEVTRQLAYDGQNLESLAKKVKTHINQLRSGKLRRILEGLSPHRLAAFELIYDSMDENGQVSKENYNAGKLRKDIKKYINNHTIEASEEIKILNKGAMVSTKVAAGAIKEAVEGAGTDDTTVRSIINNSTNPYFLNKVSQEYEQVNNMSLEDAIRKDYSFLTGQNELLGIMDNALTKESTIGIF
ncbi:MAG: hypothetical protein V2B14_07100 [bacterium]